MSFRTLLSILALTVTAVLAVASSPSSQASQPALDQAPAPSAPIISSERIQALQTLQKRHERRILSQPGVMGMGIGLADDRKSAELVVLVAEGALRPNIVSHLDGVPVRVDFKAPIRLQDGFPGCTQPCHAEQFELPVEMGNSAYSTLRCSSCTLGFKACDLSTEQFVYVTNAHCTRNQDREQAGLGSLTRHVARGDAPGCDFREIVGSVAGHADPCSPANTTVDASKIDSDFSLTSSVIRDIGWPFATPGTPALGMLVQKSGRTTGLTFGEITVVNLTVQVPDGEFICGALTMTDQLQITPVAPSTDWSNDGDSGSAVLDMNGFLVGLNFAGVGADGYANTIQNVLSELDLSLNLFGCANDCPFAEAAKAAERSEDLLTLGYRFRDEVLTRTPRGKLYADLFSRHAKDVLTLMIKHPRLLIESQRALERHRETFRSLAEDGRAKIQQSDLDQARKLLDAFAKQADGDLRSTLAGLRKDLDDPRAHRDLGIVVVPARR